jgi:hypothetical protein
VLRNEYPRFNVAVWKPDPSNSLTVTPDVSSSDYFYSQTHQLDKLGVFNEYKQDYQVALFIAGDLYHRTVRLLLFDSRLDK